MIADLSGRAALLLTAGLLLAVPAGAQDAPGSSPRPEERPAQAELPADTDAAPAPRSAPRPEVAPQGREDAAASAAGDAASDGTDPDAAARRPETDASTPDGAGGAPQAGTDDRAEEGSEPPSGAAPDPASAEKDEDAGKVEVAPLLPPAWERLAEDEEALAACLADLDRLGTVYTVADPKMAEDRDCGIANPVSVTEILPGVALEPDALMRCETARATARWMSDFVMPASERLSQTRGRLISVAHGSTYVCRRRNNAPAGKLSEHSFGNAIDVMGFGFEKGGTFAIEPRADAGTIDEAFQRAVRGAACLSFTTVLGPGTDDDHADHLHFDVKLRSGGYRLCQ